MASASLARTGSRACCWSNSVSVRWSMDLPMMSSPTKFMTASMRAASTRRVLSATATAAEPGAGAFGVRSPSTPSSPLATIFAACSSSKSPSSSCSGICAAVTRSMWTSETIVGIRQRWNSFSSDCVLARAASTTSTFAAATLSSGRGAHQAVRINAKRDVVDRIAAVDSFGNHKLFIFRPGELPRCLLFLGSALRSALRRLQQALNHFMKRVHRRQFRAFLISSQDRVKTIGGGKHDFGKVRAMSASDLRRENVFEFVREFAQFMKSASSRITLQRVHNPPNLANDFLVGRTRFELQPSFIERLQKFRGTLKEESAQLVVAIFGLTAHVVASMR